MDKNTLTHTHAHTRTHLWPSLALTLVLALAATLSVAQAPGGVSAAASGAASAASGPAGAASAPPVSVSLVRVQQRPFKISIDASGSVSAVSSVDVRPQVTTLVTQVHVKEGQFVQRGQPLFTLDARADQAALQRAQAQLQKDEAALVDAKRQLARSQDLLRQNFVSQGAVDTSASNVLAQEAGLAADQAAIDSVKVTLSYSRILAAGAGRIGTIAVFPGSMVSPAGAVLTSITQIDPIAVTFNLPQRHLADALKALGGPAGAVTATLPDGKGERMGKLVFVDSLIDPASGTVKVKATFDNKDRAMWPGAYVTVKLALQTLSDAIVVPQASIVQNVRGTIVFAAGPGNVAVVRPIKVLASEGTEAVVSGLKPGERIVLDGRQNVRPGVVLIDRPREGGGGPGGPGAGGPGSAASGAGARASGASMPMPAPMSASAPKLAASAARRASGGAGGGRRP